MCVKFSTLPNNMQNYILKGITNKDIVVDVKMSLADYEKLDVLVSHAAVISGNPTKLSYNEAQTVIDDFGVMDVDVPLNTSLANDIGTGDSEGSSTSNYDLYNGYDTGVLGS